MSFILSSGLAAALTVSLGVVAGTTANAVTTAELPCMFRAGGKSFQTFPPLAPGMTSRVDLTLPAIPSATNQFTRWVNRSDGSGRHQVTLAPFHFAGQHLYIGHDEYPYRLRAGGTWIFHDAAGRPWLRYMVQYGSRFTSASGANRIVTVGDKVTVSATLKGWNASGVEAPVVGVPIRISRVHADTVMEVATPKTSRLGTITQSFYAASNRKLYMSSPWQGCYAHESASAPPQTLLVRKRITRAVSDSTPTVGQLVRIYGTVYPALPDQPVHLQRWTGSQYVTIATVRTSRAAGGKYSFYYRPNKPGTHTLRAFAPYDAWHVSSASTNVGLVTK